jgi:hypothetical protein
MVATSEDAILLAMLTPLIILNLNQPIFATSAGLPDFPNHFIILNIMKSSAQRPHFHIRAIVNFPARLNTSEHLPIHL